MWLRSTRAGRQGENQGTRNELLNDGTQHAGLAARQMASSVSVSVQFGSDERSARLNVQTS